MKGWTIGSVYREFNRPFTDGALVTDSETA